MGDLLCDPHRARDLQGDGSQAEGVMAAFPSPSRNLFVEKGQMPSLKDLKVRINSVKSTQKITSAMKMVAAAKLRRAQEQAEAARPYAERMERMLGSLAAVAGKPARRHCWPAPGRPGHLLVVITADRGLCGAFNSSIVRQARKIRVSSRPRARR
jgi:ATP synthase F1 gamma subunit